MTSAWFLAFVGAPTAVVFMALVAVRLKSRLDDRDLALEARRQKTAARS